jgi:hypothetical protein
MRAHWLFVLAACGGGGHTSPDSPPSPDAPPSDAAERTQLAAGGVQLVISGPRLGLQITPADLATDADVIEIHQEFYGVPWDAFLAHTQPPAAWVAIMDDIAAAARATGKPVFLSVSMLDGGRATLAGKVTIDNGNVKVTEGWAAPCYDFATATDRVAIQQAYLDYMVWMIDEFHPQWLNYGIEINLFFEHCPAATAGLVTAANAAYSAAKAKQPDLIAFPSIQIDHLYGYADGSCADPSNKDACFDTNYAQISGLHRDRFAISTYPIPLGGLTVAQLPADWFTKGAARGGERLLVAETGMDSTALAVQFPNGCSTVFTETESDVGAYLARLLGDTVAAHADVVNWWSDRDLIAAQLMTDCPCTFDATWCGVLDAFRGTGDPQSQVQGEIVLKAFGTMGLRAYDGTQKSFYATWQAAR